MAEPQLGEDLGPFLNRINDEWGVAVRRVSPALLVDLGTAFLKWLESVDLYATGPAITWTGPGPGPVWMDVAREYTDPWHHQQHVREANAEDGTAIQVHISGPSGGTWTLKRHQGRWNLFAGAIEGSDARVVLEEDVAWRPFRPVLVDIDRWRHPSGNAPLHIPSVQRVSEPVLCTRVSSKPGDLSPGKVHRQSMVV